MTAVHSSYCLVSSGSETVRCAFRGRLRHGSVRVLAGDAVRLSTTRGENLIEEVLPRKNCLARPPIANVDRVVVMTAVTHPPIDPVYVDRLLVHLEARDIEAVVCLNKKDIEDGSEIARLTSAYKLAGYPVAVTSAVTGEGVPELVAMMSGASVVLAGPSGVGKSKVLSAIINSGIETGGLSRIRRGRHTTKGVTLYRVGESSFLADTPGFSRLDMIDCEPSDLAYYYKEMAEYVPLCRYPRCLHKTEEDCAVRKALCAGKISPLRYETYLALLDECLEKEKHKYE